MNVLLHERVRLVVRDDRAYVTLARGDKHNALDWGILKGLVEAGERLEHERAVRGVILHGEGPSFSSGLDFPSFTKDPVRMVRAFAKLDPQAANLFQRAALVFRELSIPVVAVVHGRCYGGGLQIALGADFRIAAPDAEISILEAKWGLVPDMSGTVTLRELLPMDQAKLLAMTGRMLDGRSALAHGLVTQVSDDPMAAAEALVAELATRSPDAVAATKRLFHETWLADEGEALSRESVIQLGLLAGKNQREAMRANFEKRPPRFAPRR